MHCGLRSADCGLKGKKPKTGAGGAQNAGDATVAHLAGGLVRRAPLTATRSAERGMTMATASGLHRGDRRARGEILVNNQDHRPAREARDKGRRHEGTQALRYSGTQALRDEGTAARAMRPMAAPHRRRPVRAGVLAHRAVSGNEWYCPRNSHPRNSPVRWHWPIP